MDSEVDFEDNSCDAVCSFIQALNCSRFLFAFSMKCIFVLYLLLLRKYLNYVRCRTLSNGDSLQPDSKIYFVTKSLTNHQDTSCRMPSYRLHLWILFGVRNMCWWISKIGAFNIWITLSTWPGSVLIMNCLIQDHNSASSKANQFSDSKLYEVSVQGLCEKWPPCKDSLKVEAKLQGKCYWT